MFAGLTAGSFFPAEDWGEIFFPAFAIVILPAQAGIGVIIDALGPINACKR